MNRAHLDLLEEQIDELREELEYKIESNTNDLSSPEVLEVNHKIDKLLVTYLKATMNE